ncbi:MAG: Uma2 family endonuclease [Clostridiales bacterium]|jgi:Uma2 family endonuclease|nr:Uma2 family endonuclease [Clostridiales bacterium]
MENLARQEEVRENIREEVLNGHVIAMSPRPLVNHNIVAGNIARLFGNYLRGKPCRAFWELDVYLTERDRVIPDVMIVCNRDIIKKNGIYGAPDLIVEVLSPSTATKDRGYKKNLYEKCGVKEYWLVDTDSRSIEVQVLKATGPGPGGRFELDKIYSLFPDYMLETMTKEEKADIIHEIKITLFDDMTIKLEEAFEEIF